MPKVKTSKSASKRMRTTGTGKVRRNRAGKSHLLSCKTRKRKRLLRQGTVVDGANLKRIRHLLPNG
ncbi:MAG TPA: 50S ribosomal protein L35 [candidate division Zixibacteria bacterium]|jgi:large subunit ribosomal protein L35|nr:50S ribosomal protein L35 [candidate division Zixibacteria bacterium]